MKAKYWAVVGAALIVIAILVPISVPGTRELVTTTDRNETSARPDPNVGDLWPLALRFAPILFFDPTEPYFPIDPQAMLDNSELHYHGSVVKTAPIRPDELSAFNDSTAYLALSLKNTSVRELYESIRPRYATPVFVGVSANDTGWIFLQYWSFYLASDALNMHEGDWEMIQVNLRPGGVPNTLGYSQHLTGRARHWWDVGREGFHPVVYVGNGSHAAYFTSGYHGLALDRCGATGLDSTSTGIRLEAGTGYVLTPISDQPWLPFAGHWGNVTGKPGGDGPPGPWYRSNGCSGRLWTPLPWFLTLPQERTGPWLAYHP